MAEFWARAGDFASAFHTANSIASYMHFGRGLAKIAGAEARAGDIAGALATVAIIPNADDMSWARQYIADAQLSVGDIPGAIVMAKGIQDPFTKTVSQHRIANAQTEAGDSSAALQTLSEALSLTENIESWRLKSIGMQHVAVSQAKAGDFTGALRVADSILDPFNVSLAEQTIAELQAKAGDAEGAQRTLAAALEAADKVEDKSIVMQAYAEAKWRIDTGNPGDPDERPIVKPPLPISAPHWVYLNDTAFNLNTPFFLDLSAAMKTLPQEDSREIMDALKEMATKLVEACETLSRMLKQQEKGSVLS